MINMQYHFYTHRAVFYLFFPLSRKCCLRAFPDTAGSRTLHDDGSVFQTLLPCLQVPEGEIGPFISLLLIV